MSHTVRADPRIPLSALLGVAFARRRVLTKPNHVIVRGEHSCNEQRVMERLLEIELYVVFFFSLSLCRRPAATTDAQQGPVLAPPLNERVRSEIGLFI